MNDASRLTKIVIEEGITTVGDMAFLTLGTYVTEVVLPSTVNTIRYGALASLTALERLEIPAGVTEIGEKAFFENTALSEVKFSGDAPTIADDAFSKVVATAYYPAGNPTWTADVMKSYGGTITWKPIVDAKVVTSGWTGENNWKLYENGTLVIFRQRQHEELRLQRRSAVA